MVHLSEHFTYKKIFKITIAPILMMIFISLYGVVDGIFVANFVGSDAYAGINLIMPIIMIVGGVGFMFGTGGSALSAKFLGEQNKEKANQVFSMIVIITAIVGIIISLLMFLLISPIANAMGRITDGTSQGMVEEAIKYGKVLVLGQTLFMLQNLFHSFFMVAEKPTLGFLETVCSGVTNIICDALFIVVLKLGVVGAALGTIMGYIAGGVPAMLYFIFSKKTTINLRWTKLEFKPILKACTNGSSEFVNSVSSSVVGIVYNLQLLKFFGQNGVAAYGTIMYVSFIFVSTFIGYSIGISPVVGYNYGAQNKKELHNVFKKSILILIIISTCMTAIGVLGSPLFARLFSSGSEELEILSSKALKIFSISFMFSGIAIFASSFFTALNNGLISAINSFLRTIVFQITFVFLLPLIIGKNGVWWGMAGAEFAAITLAIICLKANQKKYGY